MVDAFFDSALGRWLLGVIGALVAVVFWSLNRKMDRNEKDIEENEKQTSAGFQAISITHGKIFELIRELERTREDKCVPRTEFDFAMKQIANAVEKIEHISEMMARHIGEVK